MTNINTHAIALHGVLNLVDNGLSGSLNTKDLRYLYNMVGLSDFKIDTWSANNLS